MLKHFPELREHNYVSSAIQNAPRKTGEASPAGETDGKRPRGRPKSRWSNCISELAWSRLGVEPAELSEIAVDREVFQALLWMLLCDPP